MHPTTSSSKSKHFAGFTLVELIVVITILVILGTIAFTSLGGYSASARDSQRIENLANLKKGLDIFRIKTETYPLPENSISILSSGSTIGYQGFAKDQIVSIAQISKGGTLDPSDTTIYTTYSVNSNRTKMQAMVFLEDASTITSHIPSLLAPEALAASTTDYTKRTPRVIGDTLGILLGNSGSNLNQPVQELYNATSFTGVDVVSTNTGYIGIFTNKTSDRVSGTGMILSQVKDAMITGGSKYLGCDTYDIVVGTQVWAACNAGAITAWTNQTFTDTSDPRDNTINTWAGGLYQWGNNADISYTNTGTSPVVCTNTPNWSNTAIFRTLNNDWCTTQSDDLWGDTTNTSIVRQGPCAIGYHVPNKNEWLSIIKTITGKSVLWNGDDTIILQNILKLPMAGRRVYANGNMSLQGTTGSYWSSSPNGVNAYWLNFNIFLINNPASTSSAKAIGASVRCIRN